MDFFLSLYPKPPEEAAKEHFSLLFMGVSHEVGLIHLHWRSSRWKLQAKIWHENMLEKCLHIFVLCTTRHSSVGHCMDWTAWTFDFTWSRHSWFLTCTTCGGKKKEKKKRRKKKSVSLNKTHSLVLDENLLFSLNKLTCAFLVAIF